MSNASDPFSILNKTGADLRHSQFQKRQTFNRHWRGVAPTDAAVDEDDDVDIFPEARSFSSLRTEKMEERMKEFDIPKVKPQLLQEISSTSSTIHLEDIQKNQEAMEEEEEARKRVLSRRRQVQKTAVIAPEKFSEKSISQAETFKKPMEKIESLPEKQNKIEEPAVPLASKASDVKVEARSEGRAAAKARLLERQKQEEEEKQVSKQQAKVQASQPKVEIEKEESEEDSEEGSSEEESESESEDSTEAPVFKMMRPVYIPRAERDYQSVVDKEEEEQEEENRKIMEAAKQQTKMIIMEQKKMQIIGDEEGGNESDNSRQGEDFPNDDDELNQGAELEMWKIRELKRIRKDRDDQLQREEEQAEIERRSKLTNEQIMAENKEQGLHQKKEARQYVFMQKYYHKGAFYQDDELMNRDFNMPVGEEMADKSVLPDILQKRRGNFGKKGQSKYTHLTDQDTTNFDPKFKVDQNLQKKMLNKQGGMKDQQLMGSSNRR